MKKFIILLGCVLILGVSGQAFAAYEEYQVQTEGENSFQVIGRGVLNAVGLPLEISSSFMRELDMHPKAWPVTYWPRMIGNIVMRTTSASHDVLLLPLYAPFTDATEPWTEGVGLPRYPWQVHP